MKYLIEYTLPKDNLKIGEIPRQTIRDGVNIDWVRSDFEDEQPDANVISISQLENGKL